VTVDLRSDPVLLLRSRYHKISTKDRLIAQIIRLHCNFQFDNTQPLQQAHCHLVVVEGLIVRKSI